MTREELNKQTLDQLAKKLEAEGSVLVIAITCNYKSKEISQVVGAEVKLEMIPLAMMKAVNNLEREMEDKLKRLKN